MTQDIQGIKFQIFFDLIEVSNFERDRVASESTSSKNHISTLVQVSISQENLSVSSLVDCNDSGRQLDKPNPISKKCILNRTLPVADKSDKYQFLNTNQQLVRGKDKVVNNINLNGGYSKGNMEMEIIPNDSEDLPGQKKIISLIMEMHLTEL